MLPAADETITTLPLLAVDVDGVISLFGFDPPPRPGDLPGRPGSVRFELVDGTPHLISVAAGERLIRLRESFELFWATGWQDRANDRLGPMIGLPPLPVVTFDRAPGPAAGDTPAHWKLTAIDRYAGDRPIAWIDDSFDESCHSWAERRERSGPPTLLVPTEPDLGLEEGHVAALEHWAGQLPGRG